MDKEQNILKKYFIPLAKNKESFHLKNDGAFLQNEKLVISTDMMVEDQHFTRDYNPDVVARKLLRINLSDIAAMGANPYGCLLNLALPKKNIDKWLGKFVLGLKKDMEKFKVKLFGGDLSFSSKIFLNATILGKTKKLIHTKNVTRYDSDIYVSGNIGDAPLGFEIKKNTNKFKCSEKTKKVLINKFYFPEPRLEIGRKLLGKVEFCTDLSDGLFRDLKIIAAESRKQANIFLEKIPLSYQAKEILDGNKKEEIWETILSGGEDYELLFSYNKNNQRRKNISNTTKIGFFSKGKGLKFFDYNGNEFLLKNKGFYHF